MEPMALNTIPLPYGLRDVKITPYADAAATTLAGSSIDLPNSQTYSFTESTDIETLRGDDRDVAAHDKGPSVDWELAAGGISLEAYAAIAGGTVTTTGTTPNQVKRYRKLVTDVRPYFKVEGQSISDSGGDMHTIVYRAKVTGDLTGSQEDGKFWITGAKGKGYPSLVAGTTDAVYDFVQNETTTAIP
jgi:hypothetical protein